MVPKRLLDICLSGGALIAALPLLGILALLVRLTSPGPAIYWSQRVGRDNRLFWMPKFRTMRTGTPQLATHLLSDSGSFITPLGRVLRVTSLDELPQLYSVLRGDMSLVGPRPALFNQDDLIELRTAHGVHRWHPGVTGWAQINGRDELPIPIKVEFDVEYCRRQSMLWDLRILALTIVKVVRSDGYQQAGDEPSEPVAAERAASGRRAA